MFRLVVLAGIISGAFSFSSIVYFAIYYVMIPVIQQEAPLNFTVTKMDTKTNESTGDSNTSNNPTSTLFAP